MRNKEIPANAEAERLRRKADQHWEMAGLARQDGDAADEASHTADARRLETLWREAQSCGA